MKLRHFALGALLASAALFAQVDDNSPRNSYSASGGQTAFTYSFEIIAQGDLKVLKNGTTLTLTTDYTVSGVGAQGGGTVTLVAPASAADKIVIYRDMATSRTTDYQAGAKLNPDTLDRDFDRLLMGVQQVKRDLGRTVRMDPADTTSSSLLILPSSTTTRADSVLGFDSSGAFVVQALTAFSTANNSIDNTKLADMATNTVKARVTAGTGDPEDLALAANTFPARAAAGQLAAKTITDFGLSLVDDAAASNARTTLGLGTIATQDSASVSLTGGSITGITDLAVADGGTGSSNASGARTALGVAVGSDVQAYDADLTTLGAGGAGARTFLGLAIGTDVQAYDAELAALAGLTSAADKMPYFTGSGTASTTTVSSFMRTVLDDADAATARSTLGAGGDVLLSTITISAQATADCVLSGGYSEYRFDFIHVIPATTDTEFWMRTSTDGGSTFAATGGDYGFALMGLRSDGATIPSDEESNSAQFMQIAGRTVVNGGISNTASSGGVSGSVTLVDPGNATTNKMVYGEVIWRDGNSGGGSANNFVRAMTSGQRISTADVDAVRFMFASGNLTSGTIKCYGIP